MYSMFYLAFVLNIFPSSLCELYLLIVVFWVVCVCVHMCALWGASTSYCENENKQGKLTYTTGNLFELHFRKFTFLIFP